MKTDLLPSLIYGRSHFGSVFEIRVYLGEAVFIVVRDSNGTLTYSSTDLLFLNFLS